MSENTYQRRAESWVSDTFGIPYEEVRGLLGTGYVPSLIRTKAEVFALTAELEAAQSDNRKLKEEVEQKVGGFGWICQRCGVSHGPYVHRCECLPIVTTNTTG